MKPSLQFRLSQHLTLTPQLQQSIRCCSSRRWSSIRRSSASSMENPALEREDPTRRRSMSRPPARAGRIRSGGLAEQKAAGLWRTGAARRTTRTATARRATPDTPTLRDHTRAALAHQPEPARPRVRQSHRRARRRWLPHATARGDRRAPAGGSRSRALEELKIALCHLQHFEPAGVGARSPGECLSLQIKSLRQDAARARARDRREASRAPRRARLRR